jgi:hypothetical protein
MYAQPEASFSVTRLTLVLQHCILDYSIHRLPSLVQTPVVFLEGNLRI